MTKMAIMPVHGSNLFQNRLQNQYANYLGTLPYEETEWMGLVIARLPLPCFFINSCENSSFSANLDIQSIE